MNGVAPFVLLGTAIGDALGKPFETMDPGHPTLKAWDGHSYLEGGLGNPKDKESLGNILGKKAGCWTDDTQMSLALARSLIEQEGYNPQKVADAYLAWYQGKGPGGPHRGIGGSIRHAMERLEHDPYHEVWRTASRSFIIGDPVGCGSAMRAGPLGVVAHTPEEAVALAEIDARLTHNHPEGLAGSAALALMVFYARVMGPEIFPDLMLDSTISRLEVAGYRHTLTVKGIRLARELLKSNRWIGLKDLGRSGLVWEIVPSALFCYACCVTAYQHGGDERPSLAYEMAIRVGGDTDSRAAMVGAILGARYGIEEDVLNPLMPGLEDAGNIKWVDGALETLRMYQENPLNFEMCREPFIEARKQALPFLTGESK